MSAADLERNYLARSRAVHPDLAGDSAMDESSRLNEAYVTLRDPFRRVEYLLQLLGGPGAKEVSQAPPEFLEEMLELREKVEEAKANAEFHTKMEQDLATRKGQIIEKVGGQLDGPAPDLKDARMQLNAARYVNGLLRDLQED